MLIVKLKGKIFTFMGVTKNEKRRRIGRERLFQTIKTR